MSVRKATVNDAGEVSALAQRIQVDKTDRTKGFLVYALSPQAYEERILLSNLFYVYEENNHIDGFLMCYTDKELDELIRRGKLNHEYGIIRNISHRDRPFIFGDQIGILPEFNRMGIGRKLMNALFLDMKNKRITKMYVAILHHPYMNSPSYHFFTHFNFKKIEEVMNKDGLVWGIYEHI